MFPWVLRLFLFGVHFSLKSWVHFVSILTQRTFKYSIEDGWLRGRDSENSHTVKCLKKLVLNRSQDVDDPYGILFHWETLQGVPLDQYLSIRAIRGREILLKSSHTFCNGWLENWFKCSIDSFKSRFLDQIKNVPIMLAFSNNQLHCDLFFDSVCKVPGTILVHELPGFPQLVRYFDAGNIATGDFSNLTLALISNQACAKNGNPLRIIGSYPSLKRKDLLTEICQTFPNVKTLDFTTSPHSQRALQVQDFQPSTSKFPRRDPIQIQLFHSNTIVAESVPSYVMLKLSSMWSLVFNRGLSPSHNGTRHTQHAQEPSQINVGTQYSFTLIIKLEELLQSPALVIARFLRAFNILLEHTIDVLEHFSELHKSRNLPFD